MIPRLKDISDTIEALAPISLAEDWDNPGLQVGRFSQEVNTIFAGLDPTVAAIREASKNGAQMLFTHHPLIFPSISHLENDGYPGNVIAEAIQRDISIYAAHTNLDVVQGGINDRLANLLELRDIQVLGDDKTGEASHAGPGRIGALPKPMSLSALTEIVEKVLSVAHLKYVGNENKEILRVAVVGGSGDSFVSLAAEKGADVFITGDIGHHAALEAVHLGIALIDGGHFQTERASFNLFVNHLEGIFQDRDLDVKIILFENESSPLKTR